MFERRCSNGSARKRGPRSGSALTSRAGSAAITRARASTAQPDPAHDREAATCGASAPLPSRRKHAQPLRRLLDLLAPADSQAEQKRGQRRRRPCHVVCHVARKVKDGLDIRLPAIKPEFRAGRFGPLIKGVHEPNHNGCHGARPYLRTASRRPPRPCGPRRHLTVPCGPSRHAVRTPSRRANSGCHRSRYLSSAPSRRDPSAHSAPGAGPRENHNPAMAAARPRCSAASSAGRIGANSPRSDRPR